MTQHAHITCPVCGAEVDVEFGPPEEPYFDHRAGVGNPGADLDPGYVDGCECQETIDSFRHTTTGETGHEWYRGQLIERIMEVEAV